MYCVCLLPDSTFLVHLFEAASFRVPSLNLWRSDGVRCHLWLPWCLRQLCQSFLGPIHRIWLRANAESRQGSPGGKTMPEKWLHNAMIESHRHPVRKRSSLVPSKKGSYSHPNHLNIFHPGSSWLFLAHSYAVFLVFMANSDHAERTLAQSPGS